MQQLCGEFKDCYYLTREGKIYNSETKEEIEADQSHYFRLKTNDNIT